MRYFYSILLVIISLSLVPAQDSSETSPGSATVHFVRTGIMGSAAKVHIFDGTEHIGAIIRKNTITYKTTPGTHVFCGKFHSTGAPTTAFTMHLEAGGTYYVVANTGKLPWIGDVTLDTSLVKKAKKRLSRGKTIEYTAEKKLDFEERWADEIAAAVHSEERMTGSQLAVKD